MTPPDDSSPAARPLSGVKVLIVEDDEGTRYAWHNYLTRAGATVTAVADGEDAVQALPADAIDVLVIDLLLPGIDGFEVLRNLRTGRPEMVGIAVTGLVGQEERAYQAGFNAYLTKPLEPSVLAREIARRVGR
jgi:CheY-like chemotaxis protein